MNKTFHSSFNWVSRVAFVLFSLLSIGMWWLKMVIPAIAFSAIVAVIIDYVIHSTYTFANINNIEVLMIDRGKLFRKKTILVKEITACLPHKTLFGSLESLVIEYGSNKVMGIQPSNKAEFLKELNKRRLTA